MEDSGQELDWDRDSHWMLGLGLGLGLVLDDGAGWFKSRLQNLGIASGVGSRGPPGAGCLLVTVRPGSQNLGIASGVGWRG